MTRLTMAQALVRFLASQYVERDGVEQRFFAGVWGIFGHGNVAGIGEALYERPDLLPYHMARNEQSMVHTACGYARMKDRLATFACTSSIGPGATNMLTGAALARFALAWSLAPGAFALGRWRRGSAARRRHRSRGLQCGLLFRQKPSFGQAPQAA